MLVYDNIEVDKLSPRNTRTPWRPGTLPSYDAVVFHDLHPRGACRPRPPTSTFDPAGPSYSHFPSRGTLARGRVTR